MTIPVTELSDSFDHWRINTNLNGTNIGDIATLTTISTNLTDAVNEHEILINDNTNAILNISGDSAVAMAIALGG